MRGLHGPSIAIRTLCITPQRAVGPSQQMVGPRGSAQRPSEKEHSANRRRTHRSRASPAGFLGIAGRRERPWRSCGSPRRRTRGGGTSGDNVRAGGTRGEARCPLLASESTRSSTRSATRCGAFGLSGRRAPEGGRALCPVLDAARARRRAGQGREGAQGGWAHTGRRAGPEGGTSRTGSRWRYFWALRGLPLPTLAPIGGPRPLYPRQSHRVRETGGPTTALCLASASVVWVPGEGGLCPIARRPCSCHRCFRGGCGLLRGAQVAEGGGKSDHSRGTLYVLAAAANATPLPTGLATPEMKAPRRGGTAMRERRPPTAAARPTH